MNGESITGAIPGFKKNLDINMKYQNIFNKIIMQ